MVVISAAVPDGAQCPAMAAPPAFFRADDNAAIWEPSHFSRFPAVIVYRE